jgi:NADH:ubiquinone oxidoreductase subunit 2 (subunit N)
MIDLLIETTRIHAPLAMLASLLLGACVPICLPDRFSAWAVAGVSSFAASVIAIDLFVRLATHQTVRLAQLDVALSVDGVGGACAVLLMLATFCVVLAAAPNKRLRDAQTETARVEPLVLALILSIAAGWTMAVFASDFVMLFLGMQTGWLASVGLTAVAGRRDRAALTAALRMLLSGGLASALFLLGLAYVAFGAGSIDLADIAAASNLRGFAAPTGLGLMFLALATLAGAAPFHAWIGPLHGRAGGLASLAVGVIGMLGATAALARVASASTLIANTAQGLSASLILLGVIGVAIGSIQAIGAINVRRLIAYAGVAQLGCILIALGLGAPATIASALVQIAALTGSMLALFGGAATLPSTAALSSLDGLARRAPLIGFAMAIGALNLIGAPLTLGFLGRFRLVQAGVGGGWWWTAGAVIIASLAAVFYAGRLIERLYFRRAQVSAERIEVGMQAALAPSLIFAMALVLWGVSPGFLLAAVDAAALILPGDVR